MRVLVAGASGAAGATGPQIGKPIAPVPCRSMVGSHGRAAKGRKS